jgi:hypothetical protein
VAATPATAGSAGFARTDADGQLTRPDGPGASATGGPAADGCPAASLASTGVPHASQNLPVAGTTSPQFLQFIG